MEYVKQDGHFKASIVAIGLKKLPSGDPIAVFDLEVISQYDPSNGTWVDWPAGWRFTSEVWLMNDGALDEDKIKKLKEALGWNGDWTTLTGETFAGIVVQSACKGNKNKKDGKTYYRGSWIDHAEAAIRSGSNVTAAPDLVAALAAQYNGLTKSLSVSADKPAPVRITAPAGNTATVTAPVPVNAPVGLETPVDPAEDTVQF